MLVNFACAINCDKSLIVKLCLFSDLCNLKKKKKRSTGERDVETVSLTEVQTNIQVSVRFDLKAFHCASVTQIFGFYFLTCVIGMNELNVAAV